MVFLRDFILSHHGKVILFGDLNEVRNDSERFGSIFSSGDAAIFNDFIQESGLIDLPMGGRSFTWMNKIHGIMHEGVWLSDPKDIKEAFPNFYKKKFSCHDSQVSFPLFMPTHRLKTSDQDLLEAVVSMEEIKMAVWDCGSNKAPGPDGYSFLFIKRFWDLLNHNIQEFVVSFFSSGKFPQGVNFAFITLIHKVSNPLFIKDYRHISLIGLHYKIVAKILSNRLSKVINSIISPEQSAFISDFEKAFDYVSWKYLDYMLHKLGFGSRWRTWINNCLMSARTSILINGSPTSKFSLKRGLRQRDPLSPFLFIIVMEGLHMALNDGIVSNMFHGEEGVGVDKQSKNNVSFGRGWILTCPNLTSDGVMLISTLNSGKSSWYANVTSKPSRTKVNCRTLFTPAGNGIDVVIPVESIRAISERFANTAYGFFLGKRVLSLFSPSRSSESTSLKKSLRCWFGSSDRSSWNELPFCTNQMVSDRRETVTPSPAAENIILRNVGVVQTSALSRKWRIIWVSMPRLNLNSGTFDSVKRFSRFVEKALLHRSNEAEVCALELRFTGATTEGFVTHIVNYAYQHHVRQLTVEWVSRICHDMPRYIFSSDTLKHLTLNAACVPNSDWNFPALETMNLTQIRFAGGFSSHFEFLHLSTEEEGFNSLKKVNLSLLNNTCGRQRHAPHLLDLFKIVSSAKFLILDVNIIEKLLAWEFSKCHFNHGFTSSDGCILKRCSAMKEQAQAGQAFKVIPQEDLTMTSNICTRTFLLAFVQCSCLLCSSFVLLILLFESADKHSNASLERKKETNSAQPEVSLKYPEFIHFRTDGILKGTDQGSWDDFWYLSKSSDKQFWSNLSMFCNIKENFLDRKKYEMVRVEEDMNSSEVHTFHEFVAFLNLIKNDELVSKGWDLYRDRFVKVLKWLYIHYLQRQLSGPIPPIIHGIPIHLFDLYKLIECMRGYLSVHFGEEFGALAEILGLTRKDREDIRKFYMVYLDIFTSYYKTARAPKVPTKAEEDSSLDSYQWNIGKTCAPLAVQKGRRN
uniref:Transposon TX1 uncharacterized n=1 Tax=Tanacetum cinerariifolium TaxID=118510 RepID=A0A6L2MK28_TANCI|nr:transposon TX1 uncharacterized [Tanacetum cinerariifolium]